MHLLSYSPVRAWLELCSTQGADGRAGGLVHSSAEALKAAIVGYEPWVGDSW